MAPPVYMTWSVRVITQSLDTRKFRRYNDAYGSATHQSILGRVTANILKSCKPQKKSQVKQGGFQRQLNSKELKNGKATDSNTISEPFQRV